MNLKLFGTHREFGLLLLRIGVGALFVYHGAPKLFGGPVAWHRLGDAMHYLGVYSIPTVWGFLAAFGECVGGVCLALGLFFRLVCLLLLATMTVATTMHLGRGDGLAGAFHAVENAVLFLGLFFIGPGRYSVDRG